jgi:hypothetical protein
MKAEDVTDTLELALQASGCDQVNVGQYNATKQSYLRNIK